MLLAKLVTNKKVNTNRGSSMKSFNEIIYDVTKFGRKIKTSDYMGNGKYPIIDQGKNLISGYTNEENGIFVDVPAIIFGDHTRILKYIDTPFFLGADGTKILKAKNENCNLKFIYYALKNIKIPDTGYNRHYKWLKESSIIYPAIEHQDKIANILDRITSIITLKKQQLVFLEKLKHSLFVEMFGDKAHILTMNDLCNIITDGTHQSPKFVSDGIPFLFVSNVSENKISYDTGKFISIDTYKELYKRTPIEKYDILLSTVGSYGHPAIVKSNKKFLFQRHIAYLKPKKELINSIYLHAAILSDEVQRQIESKVKGIAQKTLNLSEIKTLKIPLPSMTEQNIFATIVEKIDKHKSVVQKSLDETQILFDSLMQKYFG